MDIFQISFWKISINTFHTRGCNYTDIIYYIVGLWLTDETIKNFLSKEEMEGLGIGLIDIYNYFFIFLPKNQEF